MNYSYIPVKVVEIINIYDGTCIYCWSSKTVGIINMIQNKHFYCENCKKSFISTKIKEQVEVIGEKIP